MPIVLLCFWGRASMLKRYASLIEAIYAAHRTYIRYKTGWVKKLSSIRGRLGLGSGVRVRRVRVSVRTE